MRTIAADWYRGIILPDHLQLQDYDAHSAIRVISIFDTWLAHAIYLAHSYNETYPVSVSGHTNQVMLRLWLTFCSRFPLASLWVDITTTCTLYLIANALTSDLSMDYHWLDFRTEHNQHTSEVWWCHHYGVWVESFFRFTGAAHTTTTDMALAKIKTLPPFFLFLCRLTAPSISSVPQYVSVVCYSLAA
jgi:hypothetical protein